MRCVQFHLSFTSRVERLNNKIVVDHSSDKLCSNGNLWVNELVIEKNKKVLIYQKNLHEEFSSQIFMTNKAQTVLKIMKINPSVL